MILLVIVLIVVGLMLIGGFGQLWDDYRARLMRREKRDKRVAEYFKKKKQQG